MAFQRQKGYSKSFEPLGFIPIETRKWCNEFEWLSGIISYIMRGKYSSIRRRREKENAAIMMAIQFQHTWFGIPTEVTGKLTSHTGNISKTLV